MTALALPGFGVQAGAVLSPCGRYRYSLWRTWDASKPVLVFCMLNPSTADAEDDDATIRKITRIANRLGYGAIRVVNLFALRSRDPLALLDAADPVGPRNDLTIEAERNADRTIVCAWGPGSTGALRRLIRKRVVHVLRLLHPAQLYSLRVCQGGEPQHPLYTLDAATLTPWPQ